MATTPGADSASKGRPAGGTKSGSFRDPFSKWDDNSVRGASKILQGAKEARSALGSARNRVQALNSAVGTLSGQEAVNAKRLLQIALRELAEAEKVNRKFSNQTGNLVALQTETAGKLAALRTWVMNSQLTEAEQKRALGIKKNLEKVLTDLASSKVDFKSIQETLDTVKTQQASLPAEITEKFSATEDALEQIQANQAEARQFLADHSKMLSQFGSRILSGLGSLTVRLADRMGIGAFNLGNAMRGAGMIGRGLLSAGRGVARIARGDTYVQRYMAARRTVREAGGDDDSLTSRLIEQVKKFGMSNAWFQRRLLRELESQGRDKKDNSSSIFGKLAAMIASLTGSIKGFFGSGGILKTLSAISSFLSPMAAAGKFLLTRAMPVIGAFLGGWKLGSLIYEKYAVQIGDAIDSTVGALKGAYDWVRTKIGGAADWFKNMSIGKAKDGIVNGAKAAYSAVASTASNIAQSVSSTASNAATSIAQSPVGQAATSAVTGAMQAGEAVGSTIRQGVSKLSSLVGSVISKGSNVNLDGVNPALQSNLIAMSQDYYNATGKKLQFNSGYRSNEDQARLYKSLPPGQAARPGSSLHNYGLAVDVQSSQANELQKLGLLDKYGLSRPIKNEPWHMQPAGLTLAAAKAGLYSADAPKNQQRSSVSATPASQSVSTSAISSGSNNSNATGSISGTGLGGATRRGGNIVGSRPVSLADVPTHDSSNGLLVALNLGVIG